MVVLMSLAVGATVLDFVAYSDQKTWQWNKGIIIISTYYINN